MPELPDVEVFRRRCESVLGRTVARLSADEAQGILADVSADGLRRRLEGARLTAAERHGKHLFLGFDEGATWLRLHFGMTGDLQVYEEEGEGGDEPPYTTLRLDFDDGSRLAVVSRRRLGRVGLIEDPAGFAEETELGPDPWTDPPDLEAFAARLRARSRAGIKSALMNQSVFAGLGNVYVDEILFQARIHPGTPVADLDEGALAGVHRALGEVLERAVEAEAAPDRMPPTWLLPHREEGASCPRCEGRIVRETIAGRSTYRCEAHQSAG